MNTQFSPHYNIRTIRRLREEKKKEAEKSKHRMQQLAQDLFAPQDNKGKLSGLMQHINTGIAAYDGIMTGLKILRRVRASFGRRRKI